MGHLINPTAFRLGWTLQWNDIWYASKAYYPEYLYFIYRVKLFLTYFFSLRFIEKCGYFYSHFDVAQKYNAIFINTYFYDGKVEQLMTHLFSDHFDTWKSIRKKKVVVMLVKRINYIDF